MFVCFSWTFLNTCEPVTLRDLNSFTSILFKGFCLTCCHQWRTSPINKWMNEWMNVKNEERIDGWIWATHMLVDYVMTAQTVGYYFIIIIIIIIIYPGRIDWAQGSFAAMPWLRLHSRTINKQTITKQNRQNKLKNTLNNSEIRYKKKLNNIK